MSETPPASPQRLRVALAFGGVSPEHEVSVITSLQAAAALDEARYDTLALYIAKDGTWYTGEALLSPEAYTDLDALLKQATPIAARPGRMGTLELVETGPIGFWQRRPRTWHADVVVLGMHGGAGENGGLQGLCEVLGVPYTGSGIFGSALGMDKVFSKAICHTADIPVVDYVSLRDSAWAYHEDAWLDRCEAELGYPVVVKPARLGSSIGIAKADDRVELDAAIEEALRYDEKVIVEHAVPALKEVNCSVLGTPDEAIASVLEMPLTGKELLTFQEKYMRGGGDAVGAKTEGPAVRRRGAKQGGPNDAEGMASLDRQIPAPLPDEQTAYIRDLAVRIFQHFECAGVARIDFMIDGTTGQVYFNEINTIPGSFSFYLWDPAQAPDEAVPHRLPFPELLDRMIDAARQRHRDQNSRIRSYDINLLAERSMKGLKGKG